MDDIQELYPQSYIASRARFRTSLSRIQVIWPGARLHTHYLNEGEDLTIDRIEAPALKANERVLIFTIGEHGIEAYVGSAMLQRFLDTYLTRLDPDNTGLILVHAINPWGMKNWSRTNVRNVDLNRNFVLEDSELDPSLNPDYARLQACISPEEMIHDLAKSKRQINAHYQRLVDEFGFDAFWHTVRFGQYFQPEGIHYGGDSIQDETRHLIQIYESAFKNYVQILHLDMHTGYGPRYQMSLVNSAHETIPSADFVNRFDYPIVVAANPDEFYAIQGDMIDYIYRLRDTKYTNRRLYAVSFEFGTFGESLEQQIRTLRTMVLENQARWHGCANSEIEDQVQTDFRELFAPSEAGWRGRAVADADRAFAGILGTYSYVKNH